MIVVDPNGAADERTSAVPDPIGLAALRPLVAEAVCCLDGLFPVTPIERVESDCGTILIKREDLSLIRSYKWRGAYFRISKLRERGIARIVAASAGNHAQGVALAACRLNMHATIFMPHSTPRVKRRQVSDFGGDCVEIVFDGDHFHDTTEAAVNFSRAQRVPLVEPYDHPQIIAGQATIGIELHRASADIDTVYMPVGGGGLAAGVASVLKDRAPGIRLIGVEVEGQDSMTRSLQADRRVRLADVSGFCDGTAVRMPGVHTFALCRTLLDDTMVVREDEVCNAIQLLWEQRRLIPEPSGAIGVAGALRGLREHPGTRPATIVTGANMDFTTLGRIARRAGIGGRTRRYYRLEIAERAGSLADALDVLDDTANIIDFQYGKVDQDRAWPVIGFEVDRAEAPAFGAGLASLPGGAADVTGSQTVDFRMIPFREELCGRPLFVTIDFPDRPGALHEFMRRISDVATICYFNFQSSGELSGRALIGLEFLHADGAALLRQRSADLAVQIAALTNSDQSCLKGARGYPMRHRSVPGSDRSRDRGPSSSSVAS